MLGEGLWLLRLGAEGHEVSFSNVLAVACNQRSYFRPVPALPVLSFLSHLYMYQAGKEPPSLVTASHGPLFLPSK